MITPEQRQRLTDIVNAGLVAFYGETREAVEREVLRIVGVSPLDAAALVEENAALRAENERLRETLQALVDEKLVCNVREADGSYIDVSAWCRAALAKTP